MGLNGEIDGPCQLWAVQRLGDEVERPFLKGPLSNAGGWLPSDEDDRGAGPRLTDMSQDIKAI